MNYLSILLCIFTLLFANNAQATANQKTLNLVTNYARTIGPLDLFDGMLKQINTSCNMKLTIKPQIYAELDFILLAKTNYSYRKFTKEFRSEKEYQQLVKQSVEQSVFVLTEGCSTTKLNQWLNFSVLPIYQQAIAKLKTLGDVYNLPRIQRIDADLVRLFNLKINNYQHLPHEEIINLINALESGLYFYALLSGTKNIKKDIAKAAELREFVSKNSSKQ